ARVGVARILAQRKLRQTPRLGVAADLVIAEPERGLKPPVVAVVGCEPFDESDAVLLAVLAAAGADRAGGLVHPQGVAREFLHVLLDQAEPADALAARDGGERLDVLPLAPGRSGRELARLLDGGLRRRPVTLKERKERPTRVGQSESGIGLDGGIESLVGADAVREEAVHAVLIALGGDGRGRRQRQAVAIGDAHASKLTAC